MSSFDLIVTRGDTIVLQVTVKRNNVPVSNLSTATLKCTARQLNNNVLAFQKTSADGIAISNEPAGIAVVTIDPTDTSGLGGGTTVLKCDVELTENDGTVTTIASGYLNVVEDQG